MADKKKIWLMKKLTYFITILVSLLGLYVAYQILRMILGGSWSVEDLIVGLLLFNLSITFSNVVFLVELRSDHKHLANQFKSLANDFKKLAEEFQNSFRKEKK